MRNIVDLKMDELLGKGPNNILKISLLKEKDLTDLSLALLDFTSNILAESLNS
jgi:hypothetical protein